jgi:hypothetical protein
MNRLSEVTFDSTGEAAIRYESLEPDHWLSVQVWPLGYDVTEANPRLLAKVFVRRIFSETNQDTLYSVSPDLFGSLAITGHYAFLSDDEQPFLDLVDDLSRLQL